MTQEDKKLLLKDLCARLPHKVIVNISASGPDTYDNYIPSINDAVLTAIDLNTEKCKFKEFYWDKYIVDVRPYLRPMSSMTEEERNEYLDVKMQECERVALAEVYRPEAISIVLDWLNSHHFDYRGLIEKGLALEAPMDMYKTE